MDEYLDEKEGSADSKLCVWIMTKVMI